MVTQNIPVEPYATGLPATAESLLLQHEVEQLLYLEARLLDDWNLDAWLTLYTADARYVVPTTDLPEGDPRPTWCSLTMTTVGCRGGWCGCRAVTLTGSTRGHARAGSSPT